MKYGICWLDRVGRNSIQGMQRGIPKSSGYLKIEIFSFICNNLLGFVWAFSSCAVVFYLLVFNWFIGFRFLLLNLQATFEAACSYISDVN